MLRTLGFVCATCVAAVLAACSPPAATTPASAAEAEARAELSSAPRSSPDRSARSAAAARREARSAASAALPASGQYTYVDERGKLRLAARLEDIPERQRSTAIPLEAPASRVRTSAQEDERRFARTGDVTIYSTKACGYCRAAMAHFEKLGLDYVNRDIEEDEEARAEFLELSGGRPGVPFIVIGESSLQGWSQPEFDRLLASSR